MKLSEDLTAKCLKLAQEAPIPKKRTNKYQAKKTSVDGILFASKHEAKRYGELKALVDAGLIMGLVLQPKFDLYVNEKFVCRYIADFQYWDIAGEQSVVEDAKGMKTPVYRLKKKLIKTILGIEVQEV